MSERKKASWIGWGSIALLLMLAAYPLSIGPVFFLLNSGPGERAFASFGPEQVESVVSAVYRPVTFLVDHSPDAVQRAVHSYVDWWIGLAVG